VNQQKRKSQQEKKKCCRGNREERGTGVLVKIMQGESNRKVKKNEGNRRKQNRGAYSDQKNDFFQDLEVESPKGGFINNVNG